MYSVPRGKAQGGFNVKRKAGGDHRHMHLKTEGGGLKKEFIEQSNAAHPFNTLATSKVKGMETLKIKSSRPKKYISLNV